MKAVSRFEANLLRILRFVLRQGPAEQALPLVLSRVARPPCLSRAAVELTQDSLAKGCVLLLARAGGWRKERFLRGDRVAEGRLWERTTTVEMALAFSRHALDFLIWITADDPAEKETAWSPPVDELSPADALLLYYAFAALRDTTTVGQVWRGMPAFARNGLIRLAYPDYFGSEEMPAFAPWTTGLGAIILEALQPELEDRWVRLESGKGRLDDWRKLRSIGQSQDQVLGRFLETVEAAGRLDLAGFLLRTAARTLTPRATPYMWVGPEMRTAPSRLAERAEMHQAALALVRQVDRFRGWERRARGVGYFDEGYAASQLTKETWDRAGGDALHGRAQAIIQALDPMRVQTGGSS
jgi:hypothetical protein